MKDDSPAEAARRIAEWYPHMATPNEYDRDAYTVARAYLRAIEALEEIQRDYEEGADEHILVDIARAALTDGAETEVQSTTGSPTSKG